MTGRPLKRAIWSSSMMFTAAAQCFEYTVSELKEGNTPGLRHIFLKFLRQHHQLCVFSSISSQSCAGFYGAACRSVGALHEFKWQPRGLCVTGKLKLDRDFSKYNYLSLDSAVVSGLDDAANFRTVRVSRAHTCVCMTGGASALCLTLMTFGTDFPLCGISVNSVWRGRARRRSDCPVISTAEQTNKRALASVLLAV